MRLGRGPVYVDASALAKTYLRERDSAEVEGELRGRRDLVVSDLAVTEVVSAIARVRREGAMSAETAARLHRALLDDLEAGVFRRVDLVPETHREAERMLLTLEAFPLRAADALHLAMAVSSEARCLVTFDARMASAARRLGLDAPA